MSRLSFMTEKGNVDRYVK